MRSLRLCVAAMLVVVGWAAWLPAQDQRTQLYPVLEPFESGFLQVSDLHRIYFECSGNPKGKPVLVLHGGPGAGSYPRMRQYFNPKKYLIVLHDQRGAGRSQPHGELRENTTPNLVRDVERLRKHLDLGEVVIFGGSWGTTLGLAYAEAYPDNVTGLILRGIFLATKAEVDFHYITTGQFYPKEHDALLSLLPDRARGTHPDYLFELIQGPDKQLADRVSMALARFELKFMKLHMRDEWVESFLKSFSREESRRYQCLDLTYVTNHHFLEEGQLLKNVDKIAHLPAVVICGRYDMACPPSSAFALHKALPKSKLVIVEQAGHSETEEGITEALVRAAAEFE